MIKPLNMKHLLIIAVAIVGLVSITSAQVPTYVPTNGLVGWWPFNGNANDESGNQNNGKVYGPRLSIDRLSNPNCAFYFDSKNQNFIEVLNDDTLNPVSSISLNAWVKLESFASDNQVFISKGTPNDKEPFVSYTLKMGPPTLTKKFQFSLGIDGIRYNLFSKDTISLKEWTMLTGTYDGGIMKIYLNGILNDSLKITGSISSYHTNLNFGRWAPGGTNGEQYLDGQLDDISIWNRSLTQQEIKELYNSCQVSVNTHPSSQTININNHAQFIVGTSDSSASFQWQTDLGVGFQNITDAGQYTGAQNDTLRVSNITLQNNNQNFRCIIVSGACKDTSDVAVLTVASTNNLKEFSQKELFAIYPNPAQSYINVNTDIKLLDELYTIADKTGRVVMSGILNAENITIELSHLSGGFYMFSVGENMKHSFKIIKL